MSAVDLTKWTTIGQRSTWTTIGSNIVYAFLVNGVCFSCKMIDRIRDTSRLDLLDFGLKSHSLAIRSHSVPGSMSSVSATNCFSAFLHSRERWEEYKENGKRTKIMQNDDNGVEYAIICLLNNWILHFFLSINDTNNKVIFSRLASVQWLLNWNLFFLFCVSNRTVLTTNRTYTEQH